LTKGPLQGGGLGSRIINICAMRTSSTILLLPVLSNRLGVIHGWTRTEHISKRLRGHLIAVHLKDKPTAKIDTSDLAGTVREARSETESGGE
jgi:hypothetical protein